MKLQVTRRERMAADGKALLRALQNENLPLVDLIIRESFQNSLDATKENDTIIDVGVKQFDVQEIAKHFEGIETKLLERYKDTINKSIYIADKNTTGLIGAIRDDENQSLQKSNIYKLIYGINMNQEQSGAGGSWGLGKTSFFRIGNGLVIYYTRVQLENGTFEERLAASLIEDSTKENRLLVDNQRGIAWWGEKETNNNLFEDTYPITNEKEINDLLTALSIPKYKDKETGTTVIIPFINEEILLPKLVDNEVIQNIDKSLEDAISMAIQKWYGPRILNAKYKEFYDGRSMLVPLINGKLLNVSEMEPYFKFMRDLYTSALINEKQAPNIQIQPIELFRNALDSSAKKIAGYLAFAEYTEIELEMNSPNNRPSPIEYITGQDNEKTNNKIIGFTRKPGMIIKYAINDAWSSGVNQAENKQLLGMFVPVSDAKMEKRYATEVATLDDYLRSSETADHASWDDIRINTENLTIVKRIQNGVANKLKTHFNDDFNDGERSKSSKLSKKLGAFLLPPVNFGKKAGGDIKDSDNKSTGANKSKNVGIEVLGVDYLDESELVIQFEMKLKKEVKSTVSIAINTAQKKISEDLWKRDMGEDKIYPFEIQKVRFKEINEEQIDLTLIDTINSGQFAAVISPYQGLSKFKFENKLIDGLIVKGEMNLKLHSNLVQPTIIINEER